jgi:TetR/AcrR family transcriptional regulator, cholesterol catabolism regulator
MSDRNSEGRSLPTSIRRQRRRDTEVLAAAARVFAQAGYSNASIQDIAEELGILKGSLYHYIDTKEDLLFWLLEGVHDDVERILAEVGARTDLNPLQRITEYVRRQALYNMENCERISVYYQDMDRLSPARRAALTQKHRAHSLFITTLIIEAQTDGLVDASRDARVLCNCLYATINWIHRWYRPGAKTSRFTIADTCAAFVVAGLAGTA